MILSVLIPVYNEKEYIHNLIGSLLSNLPSESEVFFIDGNSTDGTIEVLMDYSINDDRIHFVMNELRYVSHGFNKAFPLTTGKYVCLLGAHAEYSKSFFEAGLNNLDDDSCDVVGGPLIQIGKSKWGEAIANAMSSKFGVGNTEFRTESKKKYVDSVAFAMYKREVFNAAGLLDQSLIRNQDDELHYRLNSHGFRILMVPEMACKYYVRENLSQLFSQYYQYGLYKPMVLKKVKSSMRIRHLIPFFFVIYLILLPIVTFVPVFVLPLVVYILLVGHFAYHNPLSWLQKGYSIFVFPTLHISYGLGFMLGLFKK